MSRVKTGDVLSCEVCGLVVIVDEECGCAVAEIICCEEPMMNKGPIVRKKATAAAKPKKKAKPKAKKKTLKKPVTKKPALKKKAAKKPVTKKKKSAKK
jgi:hypothetical protein